MISKLNRSWQGLVNAMALTMTTKLSDVVHPQRFDPDAACLQRAAFLSRIVYLEHAKVAEEVGEYQSKMGFAFVHTTGEEDKVVCAMDADRTLFICFRGTKGIRDLFTDSQVEQTELRSMDDLGALDGSIQGAFHGGFQRRVNRTIRLRLLHGLLNSKHPHYGGPKKLVFCGHSLGGAVAHMALIKYMVGNWEHLRFQPIAIGFGAPHICDEIAFQNFLRPHKDKINERIFNYVETGDPVPRLLNNLPQSVRAAGQVLGEEARRHLKDAILVHLVRLYSSTDVAEEVEESLEWLAIRNPFDFGLDWFGLATQDLVCTAADSITTLVAAGLEVKRKLSSSHAAGCQWYVPVGKWRDSTKPNRKIHQDEARRELREGDIKKENLQCHRMAVYFDHIVRQAKDPQVVSGASSAKVEAGPPPMITGVTRDVVNCRCRQIGRCKCKYQVTLFVEGQNLEVMLVEARVVDVAATWNIEVTKYADGEGLKCELRLTAETRDMDEDMKKRLRYHAIRVEIVTCFGKAERDVRTDFEPVRSVWPNSFLAEAYFRCLCKMALWERAQPTAKGILPLPDPTSRAAAAHAKEFYPFEFLRDLNGATPGPLVDFIKQVLRPKVTSLMMRHMIASISVLVPMKPGTFDDVVDGLKTVTKEAAKTAMIAGAATSAVGVTVTGGLAAAGVATCTVPAVFAAVATAIMTVPATAAATAVGAIGGAMSGVVSACESKQSREQKYEKLEHPPSTYASTLELVCLVLDDGPRPRKLSESELERKVYNKSSERGALKRLQQEVESSPPPLSLTTRVSTHAGVGAGEQVTPETLQQCLDRAALVYDVYRADEHLRKFYKVVLLVGPENTGKTTLLKLIMRRCKQVALARSIKIGHKVHTPALQVYRVELPSVESCPENSTTSTGAHVLLVDSPGIDADDNRNEDKLAWQCLEGVPDLCFVMVRFSGDVKEMDHKLPLAIAEKGVCRNQVLMVNHVDSVLKGNIEMESPDDDNDDDDDPLIWSTLDPAEMEKSRVSFATSTQIKLENVLLTVLTDKAVLPNHKPELRKRGVLLEKEATDRVIDILQQL